MKVVLIEDEAPALAELERALRACEARVEVLARLGSIAASVAWFSRWEVGVHGADRLERPDLVICDIMLADGIALEIFDRVSVQAPIVFCTAYDHYWMQALERGGIDYLLKPIEEERMRRALTKVRDLRRHFTGDTLALLRSLRTESTRFRTTVVVKRGLEFSSLPTERIAYFTTEHKLVVLVDRHGQQYLLDTTLAEIVETLDPQAFFRANRQFVVAFAAIRSFRPHRKGRLYLDVEHAQQLVVVSQENASAFRMWFER